MSLSTRGIDECLRTKAGSPGKNLDPNLDLDLDVGVDVGFLNRERFQAFG